MSLLGFWCNVRDVESSVPRFGDPIDVLDLFERQLLPAR